MSEDDRGLAPLSSWFGPIPAWRFAILLAIGVALHGALPYVLDGVELRPGLLIGVVLGGALLGIPLGRQDAQGVLRPRRDRADRLVWPGLVAFIVACTALLVAITLVDDVLLYFPLLMAGAGAAGVTGVRSRDRALAARVMTT